MRNKRDPMTVRLYRENRHIEPSLLTDVRDIVAVGLLALLAVCIIIVVLA